MTNNRSVDGFAARRTTNNNQNKVSKTMLGRLIVLWVLCLVVIGSVAFSSYMVFYGTDDSTAKMLILPQVLAAGLALIVLPIVALNKLVNSK